MQTVSSRPNSRLRAAALFLAMIGPLTGCAGSRSGSSTVPNPGPRETHELLHATLWVQRAAEFEAAGLQAYATAEAQLARALADPTWTAETSQTGGFGSLPPAVILDVDETTLDNSPFEARLIRDTAEYDSTTWNPWCREASAEPIPGALEFCQRAAGRGVTVFYLTNRRENLREATRRNLVRCGFPMVQGRETVITRADADPSDKLGRRQAIAKEFRVVLLVGDNLGDFISQDQLSTGEREAVAKRYADWWGIRWIMIPNPMYGDWEQAILGHERGLSDSEKLSRKRAALQY